MKYKFSVVLAVALPCWLCFVLGKKAVPPQVCISNLYEGNKVLVGIDNPVQIVAAQEGPVRLRQLSVRASAWDIENYGQGDSLPTPLEVRLEGDSGHFNLRMRDAGMVYLSVETNQGIVERNIRAVPVPAVMYYGRFRNGSQAKAGEFKAHTGVFAQIECCGFDAKCEVVGFEVLRIASDNQVERAVNKGGKITPANRAVIEAARAGDIYWFRNIRYRCPGADGPQPGEDLAVEVI